MQELIDSFSFDRVSKSGAKFDADKARWYNHHFIQSTPDAELVKLVLPYLEQQGIDVDETKLEQIIPLVKERANLLPELWDQMAFFFIRPGSYDEQIIKKRWKPDTSPTLLEIADLIEKSNKANAEELSSLVKGFIEEKQLNMGAVMLPLRIALVGSASGPDLFVIMEKLGVSEVAERIRLLVNFVDQAK
jgi:glutamyl-tRNA synthetase